MGKKISIIIVDDHPIFRHGLRAAIEKKSDLQVVGEAEDGQAALIMIEKKKPDIVILDVDMPILDGIATARLLTERRSTVKKIFLTLHKDKSILKTIKSLQVSGYVIKDSAITEIVECIRAVFSGKTYLSPSLSELVLSDGELSSKPDMMRQIEALTPSEKQVLSLICQSKTNREIAEELFVSIRTIETHRYNICHKLNLSGSHALFKFALKYKKSINLLITK